jgi:hypothetical protein
VEGHFLWVRDESPTEGTETWTVACRRDLVAVKSSGFKVTNPLVEASATQSNLETRSNSNNFTATKQIWRGKKPNATGGVQAGSIASPLPIDREVCLKEIRETGFRHDMWKTLGASVVGLLGSPSQGSPLMPAAALAPGRADEPEERHTIKVMCKAVTEKAKGENNQPPAK